MRFNHVPVDLGYDTILCENAKTGRTYVTPQGNRYPSITSVLGILSEDKIREWRAAVGAEEANRVSRVAASRGTSVHSLVEDYLDNKEIDLKHAMPNAAAAFRSIQPILDASVTDIRIQEAPLYSDHLCVAGRCDLIAKFDGVLSVVDIKTSGRVKTAEDIPNYFMQEAAYAIMFEERTRIPIVNLVTVMAVDFSKPIVFKEHRDNWTTTLLETIKEHRRRKFFGLTK
jgi:genome maintenance exonuclease 1